MRTRPGTRAQVGRFERRLALWRAGEAEQRDGQVRFSVRPYFPELGLGLPCCHFTSAIFVCGISGSKRAICRVPLFHRHDHTLYFDAAIQDVTCLFSPGRYSQQRTRTRIDVNTIFILVLKYRR